jgi:hypothetical protein
MPQIAAPNGDSRVVTEGDFGFVEAQTSPPENQRIFGARRLIARDKPRKYALGELPVDGAASLYGGRPFISEHFS